MHVIRTDSDFIHLEDPELRSLIGHRIADTAEYVDHWSELVFFVVVEPGDAVTDIDEALGFPILVNRFDGIPFGRAGFTPSWDVLAEHAAWFELVYVLSDDGNGVTVFVSKSEGTAVALLAMCRTYAVVEASP